MARKLTIELHLGHVGGRLSSHLFRVGNIPWVGGSIVPWCRATPMARWSMDPGLPSTLVHIAPRWWKNREKFRHHDCFILGITHKKVLVPVQRKKFFRWQWSISSLNIFVTQNGIKMTNGLLRFMFAWVGLKCLTIYKLKAIQNHYFI